MIERGVLSLPCYQLAARVLAAVGFCAVVLMMCYHLPFWVSLTGHSFAHLPSYLSTEGLVLPTR